MMRAATIALGLCLLGCGSAEQGGPPRPPGPPERIIFVLVDTLRRDHVSAYGGVVETPNFDRIANQGGQLFPRAYSPYHQTSMSMASIFTGELPALEAGKPDTPLPWTGRTWCGLLRFADKDDPACVPARAETLAELLGQAGYAPLAIVSNELLFDPAGYSQGFDTWIEVGGGWQRRGHTWKPVPGDFYARGGDIVNGEVVKLLDERKAAGEPDRFFLYVHYMDAHDYVVKRGNYPDKVAKADAAVGRLLEILEERDLLDGTLLVFTSDHGERLGEEHVVKGRPQHHGNPSFEQLLEVPLMVWPARVSDPDRIWYGYELFSTILALAEVPAPERQSPALDPDEQFVSEQFWITYRTGRFKSFRNRRDGRHVLVDLETDPDETRDVATEHPDVTERHRVRTDELVAALASEHVPDSKQTARDRRRLRALGYLD